MYKRLLHYLKPVWFRFVVALICMAGVAAVSTGIVWVMKYLIDHALNEKDISALHTGVFLILFSIGLKSILWYIHTYLTSYVSQTAVREMRNDAYEHLYSLSMGFFNEKNSGGILAKLTNDVSMLQVMLANAPTVIVRDGLTVIGLIGYLFYTNWKFTLMCISILPISAFFLVNFGKKSRKAGREGQNKMGDIYGIIHEALAAMPIVKVFQSEAREVAEFKKENRNYFDVMMRLVRVDARSSPIMESVGAVALAIMLWVGGRDVISGAWSLGSFVAFIGAAMSLYNPIKKFATVNVQMQQGFAAGERIFELLDQRGTIVDKSGARDVPTLHTGIEFKNVSFAYPNSPTVLNNINLTVKKGDVIALVGASGSGKTTMAQLLLRFYDPSVGAVLMDGVDFRDATIYSLRKQMGVVTQETHLFNDTVFANIAYGRPEATDDEVKAAATAAFAHDFIQAMPNGYQTLIGERGARLSGGERQRIAIARALIKNPPILVLDEATSALDTVSEQAVQKALDRLLEGRTVFMIAHRLSTVRKADRIIVMNKGRIEEMGSHDELLTQKGAYHKLYELQSIS